MFESTIVAHRCSVCCAAFRRAADGALMSMRIAERKRGMSVLVGGLLQRFQRLGVEKEVEKADVDNAVVVAVGGRVLPVDDYLLETVAGVFEGERFLGHLFLVRYHPGRLDVDAFVAAVHHEVYFVRAAGGRTLCPGEVFKGSNVNIVAAPYEFVEDYVFHQMRAFTLTLRDMDVPYACIGGVVFRWRVEVALTFDIVSSCLLDEKRVFKVFEIVADGDVVGWDLHGRGDCVREFAWIGEAADVAHDDVGKRLEDGVVFDLVPGDDILKVDCLVKVLEIIPLLIRRVHEDTFRKAAEQKVVHECGVSISGRPCGRQIFAEGQWRYVDNLASSAEFRSDVPGKHLGIGTGDVCDDIRNIEKSVQYIVERDITTFAVVGVDSGQVDADGEYFLDILDFVEQHIHGLPILWNELPKMFPKEDGIAECDRRILFEVDGYDMGIVDAMMLQVIAENGEEEVAFPASPNARDEFHEMVVLRPDEFVKKFFSLYCHSKPPFENRVLPRKLKAAVLYHVRGVMAMVVFKKCNMLTNLKVVRRMTGGVVGEKEASPHRGGYRASVTLPKCATVRSFCTIRGSILKSAA